ncbi:MAG: cytochrome P450 [Gloeocapsa sp. UFS-A4-WI-NPMV-4B04]|jgi:cytochrome P450|nr:cytochrome P450 [Gloeocapsa sp. UFS-A4-WI-NPMV-4B04]
MTLPDGPKTLPFLQLIQWIANPLALLETSRQRYGDPFTLRLGSFAPLVFFSNPQAIQEIFTAQPNQFDTGRANGILRPLVGDQSLLLLDGDRHQQKRRLLTPPFHGDRMKSYGQLICDITQQVINQWTIGEPFAARSSMQNISFQVILQAVFGLNEGQRCEQLKQLLPAMLDVAGSPLSSSLLFFRILQQDLGAWSPWGHFVRQRQQIDEILYAEIAERRQQTDLSRTDILSLLMSARDQNDQPMTDTELRDELMTLLTAGHETTASALSWALYWIHSLPDVHHKLLQELDTFDDTDLSGIAKLPYLSAVCQETLRIYPIAMLAFARVVKSPFQFMGYELEPNTLLAPCIYLTHHREDLYPEPKLFKPERFLERQFSTYEYLPFGGGNRRCIGVALALFEMKLVLATILSRSQLQLVENSQVKPMRRGVTLAPSGGKWLVATSQRQKAKIPVQV